MVFQANTYSVLLVSASEKNVAATLPLLPPSDFYPVAVAGSVNEARRRLMEESYSVEAIAEKMKSLYEWILGYGDKPAYVYDIQR